MNSSHQENSGEIDQDQSTSSRKRHIQFNQREEEVQVLNQTIQEKNFQIQQQEKEILDLKKENISL